MDILLFEHPLDELTRLSLRIEFILDHFNFHIQQNSLFSERTCIASIVNLSHLLDRPDLKSKYAREFSAQITQLKNVASHGNVDLSSLSTTIETLRESFDYFSKPGKIGLNLRENYFLNTMRQHLSYPGGEADFEVPGCAFWLHTSREEKISTLNRWFSEFTPVIKAILLLLKLIRSRKRSKQLTAFKGAHHEPLDGRNAPKLIQLYTAQEHSVYPTISAGKYRINVRFNEGRHLTSQEQALRDIDFELALCW